MPGKFHPDDLKNPLYERSQVVTVYELNAICQGLAMQYHKTHWWEFKLRYELRVSERAIYELIIWLHQGKPII